MADEIGGSVNRPKQYENIDGTVEMGLGALSVCIGLLMCAQFILPVGLAWSLYLIMLGPVAAGIHFGRKAIKNRITYRRTGYVALRGSPTMKPSTLLLIMITSAGFCVICGFAMRSGARPWSLDLACLGLSSFLIAGYGLEMARFISRDNQWKWVVVAGMAIGSLVISSSGGDFTRFLLLFLFFGCCMLASGGISLYLYLRSTQTPVQPE